jgi:hypothetical protein
MNLGGYYGKGVGRRGGTISHFLLGVMKTPELYAKERSKKSKKEKDKNK